MDVERNRFSVAQLGYPRELGLGVTDDEIDHLALVQIGGADIVEIHKRHGEQFTLLAFDEI